MRKVVAAIYLSLDGVMENPAWTMPYWNEELSDFQSETMYSCEALLLGRVTYQGFAAAWPKMEGEAGADRMNSLPKYIASTTLTHTEWNAELLQGDVPAAVRQLKQQPGQPLLIYGSGALIRSLMPHNLIDEYRLMVYPVVLGHGQRLFTEGSQATLKLVAAQTTRTGVALLTYQPANK